MTMKTTNTYHETRHRTTTLYAAYKNIGAKAVYAPVARRSRPFGGGGDDHLGVSRALCRFSAQTLPTTHTLKSPVRISATRRCGQGFLLVADRIQGRISCLFEKQRNRNVADRQKVCLYS